MHSTSRRSKNAKSVVLIDFEKYEDINNIPILKDTGKSHGNNGKPKFNKNLNEQLIEEMLLVSDEYNSSDSEDTVNDRVKEYEILPSQNRTPNKSCISNAKIGCKRSSVTPIKLKRKLFTDENNRSKKRMKLQNTNNDLDNENELVYNLSSTENLSTSNKEVISTPKSRRTLSKTMVKNDKSDVNLKCEKYEEMDVLRSKEQEVISTPKSRRTSATMMVNNDKSNVNVGSEKYQEMDISATNEQVDRNVSIKIVLERLNLDEKFDVDSGLNNKSRDSFKQIDTNAAVQTPTRIKNKKESMSTPKSQRSTPLKELNVTPTTRVASLRLSSRIRKSRSLFTENDLPKDDTITEYNTSATPSSKNVLSTPKRKLDSLTPRLSERKSILRTPTTPLDHARQQLHVSAVPDSLPCRQTEFDTIYRFLLRKINTKTGGSMYISGVPGTGKTATVLRVIKKLEADCKKDKIPFFKFVDINSLQLTEPHQAYCKFWKKLTGDTVTAEQAQKALEKKFSARKMKKEIIVLLIDELDYLCNKRQDVVYNILDWPTRNGSRLIVLTIANTMDLPERTLKGRVTSRMGLTRLVFQPYTYQQLQTIVLNRLSGNESFHPDAIQLAARKVASISGDARRALDICRRAIDIASAEHPTNVVTIAHVEEAVNNIMSSAVILAIKAASTAEKFVLRAIRDECLRNGLDVCSFDKMYDQFQVLSSLEGKKVLTMCEVYYICIALDDLGLIMAEKRKNVTMKKKLSLNVSPDDIHYALEL